MIRNHGQKFIVILIILSLITAFIFIYLASSKYDDVPILSVKHEYNMVFTSKDDCLDIPLYIGRNNTFISNYEEIESTSISNMNYTLISYLESVEMGSKIKYNNQDYYEFIFSLSLSSYDDYNEPIFLSDGLFNINYKNGERLSFKIGNLSLFFNTGIINYNDLIIMKLNAVMNEVDYLETIVGINLSLYNNTNDDVTLNKIEIKNKYYGLDYMSFEFGLIDSRCNLKERDSSYSYIDSLIRNGDMNLVIRKEEIKDIFIPLKYINGIKYLNRFPLYFTYKIGEVTYNSIQDDFLFSSSKSILNSNGIEKYVYKYN